LKEKLNDKYKKKSKQPKAIMDLPCGTLMTLAHQVFFMAGRTDYTH
jgi:hypothetical protein